MGYIEFAPTFAVKVRDLDDYAPDAEATMAAKRADYFEAGTLVVWDVDIVRRPSPSSAPGHRRRPSSIGAGKSPRPNRRCGDGGWPSTGSSRDQIT